MSNLVEITAVFQREKHRWDQTVIAQCLQPPAGDGFSTPLAVKCVAEEGELVPHRTYRFYGRIEKHPKWGDQFHAKTFVETMPHGEAGTVRYLQEAPHVGPAIARRLWEKFAGEAVRILREQPDVAAAAVGKRFPLAKAQEAAALLESRKAVEDCTIDLVDLFARRGFPRDFPRRCMREWGNKAAELIRRNPYLLMRLRGAGFGRCDKLYLDRGGDPARLKRQAWCLWHWLHTDSEGHTWRPAADCERALKRAIGGAGVRAIAAARLAIRGKLVAVHKDDAGGVWLAEAGRARSEETVVDCVGRMLRPLGVDIPVVNHWPQVASLDVSDHQAAELHKALQGRLGIFGGSPGTGKTYTLAKLIGKLVERHGEDAVAVCAPTGKAAVRVTEFMEGMGLSVRARTIHSLLGVTQQSEGDGWGFSHGPGNPLEERYILVDEGSMVDSDLMASLVSACDSLAHVLVVADTCQLPPVGHGAPVRDMIAAGVPFGELSEIRRNSGAIVRACLAIKRGKAFEVPAKFDPAGGDNLALLPARDGQRAADAIVETLRRLRRNPPPNPATGQPIDPVWDVQVLVAVNRKSPLSRRAMNERLQEELNPAGRRAAGNPFRVGDKVVNTKNGWFPRDDDGSAEFTDEHADGLDDDGRVFVANGELGRVVDVSPKLTIIELEGPRRRIRVPRGAGKDEERRKQGKEEGEEEATSTGCTWELGYALSVHKSQGSEWPVVIVALDEYPGAMMVCGREWLYTAISRAKLACFLVGKPSTAMMMIRRPVLHKRKTFLAESIRLHLAG